MSIFLFFEIKKLLTPGEHNRDDEFIRRFTAIQSDLRAFVVGMTPSRSDADDVLQEVNLALWHKRDAYDQSRDFLRWAFGFAMTEIRSYRSKSAKSRLWFKDSVLDSLSESWSSRPNENEDRRDALTHCLQKLGAEERQYVANYYGKQLSAQTLSDEFGRPLSTVYKILSRARMRLRDCVTSSLAQAEHGS